MAFFLSPNLLNHSVCNLSLIITHYLHSCQQSLLETQSLCEIRKLESEIKKERAQSASTGPSDRLNRCSATSHCCLRAFMI